MDFFNANKRRVKAQAPAPNTFIGGMGAIITTPALLASRLTGIVAADISLFSVDVSNNISCLISKDYSFVYQAFYLETALSYYLDITGNVKHIINDRAFTQVFQATNLKALYFPELISVEAQAYVFTYGLELFNNEKVKTSDGLQTYRNCGIRNLRLPLLDSWTGSPDGLLSNASQLPTTKRLYVPKLIINIASNLVFGGIKSGNILYANPAMATINGGAPAPSITYAIGNGAIVRYVTNFIKPSKITNLAAGTITANSVVLNFTPPASSNALDFYDVWVDDGVHPYRHLGAYKELTAPGQTLTGLSTGKTYKIKVVANDIFYNQSDFSNVITITTL